MSATSLDVRFAVRAAGTGAAVLIAAAVLAGQELSSSQTPFRAATDLIPVDVSVLDGNRRPVRGLTAGDFTVLVDGQPRPIAAFTEVSVPLAEPITPASSWLPDAPHEVVTNTLPGEGRLVAILLDRSIPRGEPMLRARRLAAAAIDQLGPGDLAAVVRSSGFSGDGQEQGFTSDRSRLLAAIESPAMGLVALPQMTGRGLQPPSPVPSVSEQTGDCYCGICVFEPLVNVAAAMRDAPRRRKQLLLVGSAIRLTEDPQDRECFGVVAAARDRLFREIEASNITVHVLDPAGLITVSSTAEQPRIPDPRIAAGRGVENQNRLQSLRILPDRTGGRLVTNTNDPEEHVPAIFDESQSYYLLGFEPATSEQDGRLHRIEVRVNRRDVHVRSRTAYSAGPPGPTPTVAGDERGSGQPESGPPVILDELLAGPLPRSALPLSMSVVPLRIPARREAALALVLGADLPKLAQPPAGRLLAVTAAAFNLDGKSMAVTRRMMTMPAEAVGESPQLREGIVARLELPPGRYEIRAAVRDETSGVAGTVFTSLDVPDFVGEALTLSGVFVRRPTPLDIADSPIASLVPFTPTIERTFDADDLVLASVRVYQGGDDMMRPVRISSRVVDREGRTVFQEQTELPAAWFGLEQETDYELALPLASLAPGRYLLTIDATLREIRRTRDVRFAVQ